MRSKSDYLQEKSFQHEEVKTPPVGFTFKWTFKFDNYKWRKMFIEKKKTFVCSLFNRFLLFPIRQKVLHICLWKLRLGWLNIQGRCMYTKGSWVSYVQKPFSAGTAHCINKYLHTSGIAFKETQCVTKRVRHPSKPHIAKYSTQNTTQNR